MEINETRKNAYMMLRLIAGMVDGQQQHMTIVPDDVDISALLKIAQKHSLSAITAAALETQGFKSAELTEITAKAMRKSILTDRAFSSVSEALSGEHIRHLPLKGVTLKPLYPKDWMREMSDVDVLIEQGTHETVSRIMQQNGYTVTFYGKNNEDVYTKPPYFCFEMHRTLFDGERFPDIQACFDHKTYLPTDDPYRMQMSVSDAYIYLITHMYMHYFTGGTGLRSLLDIRLFLQRYEKETDRAYVEAELEKTDLLKYESKTKRLASCFLDPDALSDDDRAELDYYIFSGTYGNKRQYAHNRVARKIDHSKHYKIKYIKNRFAIPENQLREHPFYLRHPRLRFIYGTKRIVNAVFKKKESLMIEIKALKNTKRPPRT